MSTCLNPQINPTETTLYILNVTDSIGCINSDTVEVNIKGDIFVQILLLPMETEIMIYLKSKEKILKVLSYGFTIDGVKKFIILPK